MGGDFYSISEKLPLVGQGTIAIGEHPDRVFDREIIGYVAALKEGYDF